MIVALFWVYELKNLKIKNSEGFDRIPQRILIDGMSELIKPFSILFNLIYTTNQIPEQWHMAKITPIYKKGDKNIILPGIHVQLSNIAN